MMLEKNGELSDARRGAAARHRALRGQRRLPPQAPGRLFRRDVHEGRLRRVRLLPRRARDRRRPGHRRAQDPVGVARVGQRFGAAHVTNVLRGSDSEQVRSRGHHELSVFGLMKDATIDELRGYIDQLLAHGLLQQGGDEYPILQITAEGLALLKDAGAAPELSLARQKRPDRRLPKRAARRDRRRGKASIASCSKSCACCAWRSRAGAACRRTSSSTTRRCGRSRGRSRRRRTSCATSTASAIGRPKTSAISCSPVVNEPQVR